jgi:hypothetical protein
MPFLVPCLLLLLLLLLLLFCMCHKCQSVQGTILVYHRGSCGNTTCCLIAHLLFYISQAGL